MRLKQIIKELLQKHHLRDDDLLLYATVCREYGQQLSEISAWILIKQIGNGKLPKIESVSRIRRMIQMQEPNLRGSKWLERHKEQDKVKSDLGYNVTFGKDKIEFEAKLPLDKPTDKPINPTLFD